jgi:hypothetical protein
MQTSRRYYNIWLRVLQFIDSHETIDPVFGDASGVQISIDEIFRGISEPSNEIANVLLRLFYIGLADLSDEEQYRCRQLRNTVADRAWLRNH